ncbi:alpha/beta hydrolase [Tropicimonas sp. TH_r6]|uniref:alpha/beta fold hydrolase n=1 Tax=Tropicimonas sp. TH_r6 TaxID=3082085 RepID=UPI00295583F1|nr:alpha/beta hydrolase [Tropicimonas sp. TH_r6]MDV7141992.1 alpha/beta hydrolase [Tropicimonas sp. TH_r6]
MTDHFITEDGLSLAFDDQGSGHPLLCLAGLTRNMDDFAPVVAGFAGTARILRLDSRGRGRSQHDPDFHNYNIAQEARDAIALLDHLELETVSILGTSRGGLIAMVLAASHPERIHGAILNDIGPAVEERGLSEIMAYLGQKTAFRSHDEAVRALPSAMSPAFTDVPEATWRAFSEALWSETAEGLELRYDPALRDAIVAQSSEEGAVPDLWPLYDALATRPIALIRGENSNILSRETAKEMHRRQPALVLAEIAGRGHVPFLDEPAAQAVIADYLDRVG